VEKSLFAQEEERILKFWQENKIFEKSVDKNSKDKQYVFYDGPPFATGLPHYGHILSSVIKDLVPRYQTMKGSSVRRRWGWDCHGLPIEHLVEKELGVSGKKEIEKLGVDKFNQKAREMVLEYVREWKKTVDRIGRWVDFDNSYKTMDNSYMESVWWTLKTIWEKNLIYEGRKVLLYCTRCETPISNAEIAMDNSYKDVTEESLIVKFKLKAGQNFSRGYEIKDHAYILAWTTTPWTLPGNVALAVGDDIKYSAIRIRGNNELYIVASKLTESIFKNKEIEIVHDDLLGRDISGLEYEPLFEIEAVKISDKRHWYVVPASFVTTDEGTGVVHTAVMYGEDDYLLGQQVDLPQVPLLDQSGKFNNDAPAFLQGKNFKDAEHEIKQDLESRGLVFEKKAFTHSYPFCWRCESPLIYNAISAWFIDIQKNKHKLIELNHKINWYPEYLKEGRFKNILDTAPDWNISRNRYWATPLPFFKCNKCNEQKCIGSIEELKGESKNFDEIYPDPKNVDIHRPQIDKIAIACKCGGEMKRIEEVVDCWVESGAMPYAEWHFPFENEEVFKSRFPGQFIAEYIAQTRAWFYYMHVLGVLLFDDISYENVVATGTILNEKGEKLSKSKKNFPDPWIMIDKYGADALRYYLMTSVVMQADNLFFNEADLKDVYSKVINITYNISRFYSIYESQYKNLEFNYEKLGLLDRWIVSRLSSTIKVVTENLDAYSTVRAGREIKGLLDDFSTWWLRRSRERFKSGNKEDEENAFSTMKYCLVEISKILAPFTPFMAESLWQKLRLENDEESVHLAFWPQYKEEYINKETEEKMEKARQIVEAGHSLRDKNNIRVRQTIAAVDWEADLDGDGQYEKLILDELNVEKRKNASEMVKPDEASGPNGKIIIETDLSPRLLVLGDVREVTRAIQYLRKKMGFEQGEVLNALYYSDNNSVIGFMEKSTREICEKTNLKTLIKHPSKEDNIVETSISLGKVMVWICENSKD